MVEVVVTRIGQTTSETQPPSTGVSAPVKATTAEIVKAIPLLTTQVKEVEVVRKMFVIKSSKKERSSDETILKMIVIVQNPGSGQSHPDNGQDHLGSG